MNELYNKIVKPISLLLLLLFAACEETVELGNPFEESLTVSCHFSPENPFQVYVSKSLDPLSNEDVDFPVYIEDGQVAIYQGESFVCELPFRTVAGSIYPSDFYINQNCIPEAGVEYTIRVSAPGFEEVIGTNVIPAQTRIESFELSDLETEMFSDTTASFTFNVELLLGEHTDLPAYYLLNLNYERVPYQVVGNDTIIQRTGEFEALLLESLEGNPSILNHYDKEMGNVLFVHKETGALELNFKVSTPRPVLLSMDLFKKIYANLRTVSKDYYFYHAQLSRQEAQRDSFFVSPVIIPNNIENGYGIFAGYQLTKDSLPINPQ